METIFYKSAKDTGTYSPLWARLFLIFQLCFFVLMSVMSAGDTSFGQQRDPMVYALKAASFLLPYLGGGLWVLFRHERFLRGIEEVFWQNRWFLLFLLAGLISLPMAVAPAFSGYKLLLYAGNVGAIGSLVGQYICLYPFETRHRYAMRHLTLAFSTMLGIAAYCIFRGGIGEFFLDFRNQVVDYSFSHPNNLSAAYAQLIMMLMYLSFAEKNLRAVWRVGFFLAGALVSVVLFLLQTRSIIGAMLFASMIVIVAQAIRGKSLYAHMAMVALIMGPLIYGMGLMAGFWDLRPVLEFISRSPKTLEDLYTFTGRTYVWEAILRHIDLKQILVGHGFAVMVPSLSVDLGTGFLTGAHNSYLFMIASVGIVGVIGITGYLYRMIRVVPWYMQASGVVGTFLLMRWSVMVIDNLASDQLVHTMVPSLVATLIINTLIFPLYRTLNGREAWQRKPDQPVSQKRESLPQDLSIYERGLS